MSIKSGIRPLIGILIAFSLATPALAQVVAWRPYQNPRFGYTIELPIGPFEQTDDANGAGVSLTEPGGDAQLDVFGATNVERLGIADFRAEVERADRIRRVTYRAMGSGWFVLSGYYRREGDEREDLIFYAKFMFNRDRSAVSAFEISYPLADKARFDGIVTHLEKSLRAPR